MALWDEAKQGWIVDRYDEAAAVLRDATTFTVDDPRFSTALVVGPSMLSTDGADHARQRRAFQPLFTKRMAAGAEETVSAIVDRRVAVMAVGGEWRTGFAAPVAVDVMVDLFALPISSDVLLDWYRTIVAAVSAAGDSTAGESYGALSHAILGGDVIANLLADDDTITSTEAASNTAVALFGGIETVEGTIAAVVYHAFGSASQRDALLADDALVGPFVEEVLRFDPAAAVVHRYVTADVELDGRLLRVGDFVEVSILDANRDPAVFEAPAELKLDRPNSRAHLSFAVGPHVCLGLHLARLEATVALRAVLAGHPDALIDHDRSASPSGSIFRKPDTVYFA